MNSNRIKKIIKHAGKLLQQVLTELFGEEKEKEESNDKIRNKEPD